MTRLLRLLLEEKHDEHDDQDHEADQHKGDGLAEKLHLARDSRGGGHANRRISPNPPRLCQAVPS